MEARIAGSFIARKNKGTLPATVGRSPPCQAIPVGFRPSAFQRAQQAVIVIEAIGVFAGDVPTIAQGRD